MRYFYLNGEEITEEEAKRIEAQNREILWDGTVEELLQIRHIIYKEDLTVEENAVQYPICCDCQFCGDKFSFPPPNDKINVDPENPLLKHYYCCCGDCDRYERDVTGLGLKECNCFEEL